MRDAHHRGRVMHRTVAVIVFADGAVEFVIPENVLHPLRARGVGARILRLHLHAVAHRCRTGADELPVHQHPARIAGLNWPEARMVTDGGDIDARPPEKRDEGLTGMPPDCLTIDLNRTDILGHDCLTCCHVRRFSECHRTPPASFQQARPADVLADAPACASAAMASRHRTCFNRCRHRRTLAHAAPGQEAMAAAYDTEIILDGRYRLERCIGVGGMATVYRAWDEELHRHVAVKMLHASRAADPTFVERFKREASATANLAHPDIVAVYTWGASDNTYYIVMEYVDGP